MARRYRLAASSLIWGSALLCCASSCSGDDRASDPATRKLFEQPIVSSVVQRIIDVPQSLDTLVIGRPKGTPILAGDEGTIGGPLQDVAGVEISDSTSEIYVADKGARRIQVYSLNQKSYLHALGREGTGPGDFLEPADIFLVDGGHLGAWDPVLRRVSVFFSLDSVTTKSLPQDAKVRVSATMRLGRTIPHLRAIGGEYVFESHSDPLSGQSREQAGALIVTHRQFEDSDTLLLFRIVQVAAASTTGRNSRTVYYQKPPLFSPQPSWAVAEDGRIALAPGGPYEFVILSKKGKTAVGGHPVGDSLVKDELSGYEKARFTRMLNRELVSRADRMRLLASEAANPKNGLPKVVPIPILERMFKNKFSVFRPEITGLLWDGAGRLWVRRFGTAPDPRGYGSIWDVLQFTAKAGPAERATITYVLRFDGGLTPLKITRDELFAVQQDSLGVQRVVILPNPLRGIH